MSAYRRNRKQEAEYKASPTAFDSAANMISQSLLYARAYTAV